MSLIYSLLFLYSAMHLYVLFRVHRTWAPGPIGTMALCAALAGMLVLSLAAWKLDHSPIARWIWIATTASYLWMALVVWFTGLSLAADAWNIGVFIVSKIFPGAGRARIPPRRALQAIGLLLAAGLAWGVVEASRLRIREITIASSALPAGSPPVRIAVLADLHLKAGRGGALVRRLVRALESIHPDLVVSLGDLTDAPLEDIREKIELLRDIQAPLGKYAVLGNHEFFTGIEPSLRVHEAAGFRMLRQEAVAVTPYFFVAGADDPAGARAGGTPPLNSLARALNATDPKAFVLALQHQPRVDPATRDRFDLQLSGHTHGGQMFPFHLIVRRFYPFIYGGHFLSQRSLLYISRGAGTWGPPLRVLAPPELTIVTVTP